MRQLIIARKDLQMSPGKLAAQCCHASLAFLTDPIGMGQGVEPIEKDGEITGYRAEIMLEKATYEEWFDGSFTKTVSAGQRTAINCRKQRPLPRNWAWWKTKTSSLSGMPATPSWSRKNLMKTEKA